VLRERAQPTLNRALESKEVEATAVIGSANSDPRSRPEAAGEELKFCAVRRRCKLEESVETLPPESVMTCRAATWPSDSFLVLGVRRNCDLDGNRRSQAARFAAMRLWTLGSLRRSKASSPYEYSMRLSTDEVPSLPSFGSADATHAEASSADAGLN
jgi:hypothetical protein